MGTAKNQSPTHITGDMTPGHQYGKKKKMEGWIFCRADKSDFNKIMAF